MSLWTMARFLCRAHDNAFLCLNREACGVCAIVPAASVRGLLTKARFGRPKIKSASREVDPSARRSRRDQRNPAEQADHRKQMQNSLPHRNLVLEAERGRATRRPLLDAHVAMLVSRAPGDQLDERFRLIGEAVGRDFYSAQQLVTLEN